MATNNYTKCINKTVVSLVISQQNKLKRIKFGLWTSMFKYCSRSKKKLIHKQKLSLTFTFTEISTLHSKIKVSIQHV